MDSSVDRRIGKEIREHAPIKKGERLRISDPLCLVVFKEVIKGLPVVFVQDPQADVDKEIISWTMDDEIEAFCIALFEGKPLPHIGQSDKKLKLFLQLTDAEVQEIAKSKGIVWRPNPKPPIHERIEGLTKKYPELKNSLMKSLEELKTVLAENI